jgi:hypothetical protein
VASLTNKAFAYMDRGEDTGKGVDRLTNVAVKIGDGVGIDLR